ncbi:RabGAP/TBC [Saccharata proteae CBS 121410]|uniref:RabGAP/TBC n=1 Tax=Saccharata proteae CBS 121410 TaxID=1314787 RepID=A0A9P4HYD4_9PEZI|nr:RabGAP/TBC [Saccharata proteae CBS 121410]
MSDAPGQTPESPPTVVDETAQQQQQQQRPSSSRSWFNAATRRPRTSPGPRPSPFKSRSFANDDVKRDSGFAPAANGDSDVPEVPRVPTIIVHDEPPRPSTANKASELREEGGSFKAIDTSIPVSDFDEFGSDKMEFSKRGSVLLGGKRPNAASRAQKANEELRKENAELERDQREASPLPGQQRARAVSPQRAASAHASTHPSRASAPDPMPRTRSLAPRRNIPGSRILSADETTLSKKVRSMYMWGDEKAAEWVSDAGDQDEASIAPSIGSPVEREGTPDDALRSLTVAKERPASRSPSIVSRTGSSIIRQPHEVAGGIEDWEDIESGEVDRYGFIVPKKITSPDSTRHSSVQFEAPRNLARVATQLQLASEGPRRKRTLRRAPSNANRSSRAFNNSVKRPASRKSLQPPESVRSVQTNGSVRSQNPLRHAANRLPHNRDRRLMDEASDMLTLPPGLADIAEEKEDGRNAEMTKRKEWRREEKWRRMAHQVGTTNVVGGMTFEFDTKNPKLIERTWKGIPDKWRSTAWYAFLAVSAQNVPGLSSEEELIEAFYQMQEDDSADDMQIDVDVPRTISHHIMFRRRYRGGQRLLFRVLHAISLYLPETGYVQGMAALAATLLCYYDEEKAFVMLVRMWKLRGLERLYENGFDGLMEALGEFENKWLKFTGEDVAKKLEEFGITSTAYGTRWYLTLFNYSIPFPAQLRVWDVFMLLGDASNCNPDSPKSFGGDLDPLHATSAALIDATRDILLDSDFEVAMKTLTSWVPVKDEDLLMRVAKAEWKQRKKRAKAGGGGVGGGGGGGGGG